MGNKILRQGLNVSANELSKIADDLESQTRRFNLELGEEDIIDFDKKWSINIINRQPKCSDTWEIEELTEEEEKRITEAIKKVSEGKVQSFEQMIENIKKKRKEESA